MQWNNFPVTVPCKYCFLGDNDLHPLFAAGAHDITLAHTQTIAYQWSEYETSSQALHTVDVRGQTAGQEVWHFQTSKNQPLVLLALLLRHCACVMRAVPLLSIALASFCFLLQWGGKQTS